MFSEYPMRRLFCNIEYYLGVSIVYKYYIAERVIERIFTRGNDYRPRQCCIYFIIPILIKIVKNVIPFEWKIPILARRFVTLLRIYVTSSQQ